MDVAGFQQSSAPLAFLWNTAVFASTVLAVMQAKRCLLTFAEFLSSWSTAVRLKEIVDE
jgi:hypothetical protein